MRDNHNQKVGVLSAMVALAASIGSGPQAFNRAQGSGHFGHGSAPRLEAKEAQAKKRRRRLIAKASRARNRQ